MDIATYRETERQTDTHTLYTCTTVHQLHKPI